MSIYMLTPGHAVCPQPLLIDTCVLIDHLRGHEPARQWLSQVVVQPGLSLAYSVITLAELLSGLSAEATELEAIRSLLALMEAVPVDDAVAARAAAYMRRWRKSHGVAMADVLIAASASTIGATLITRDVARFPMEDLKVSQPY